MAETPSWLSQYPEVKDDSWLDQYKEVKEKPFLDISETASALGRAATSLPTTTMASLSQAWEGLDNPWKRSEGYFARRQEMQALQDELAKEEEEAAASGDISTVSSTIREATPSLGFSGATLIPSMGAAAGTLALSKSPMAARGAAAATSALMAYRMAGAQFLDDAKDRIDSFFAENLNREPTEQEKEEAYQELLPLARKFGAAEAGPEALGNLALGGAGKYIRRALGGKNGVMELASNALGKVTGTKAALAGAGALVSEIGTEAVTGVEQQRIQKQFEEGVMRGESPESVPLEERTLDDYIKSFKEVAPATMAMTGMMGAAGLGPTAIARGIKALRPTPPERQTQIQKDLQAEAGAIPKDTVPDQTNEEKLAAMEAGGTTVVDPDGKTAVIPPQQPELPSMPSPDEVAVQLNTDAAKSLEAAGSSESAKAQAGFDATLKEIFPKTSQPTIQPEQAAEEVAPEVTPSPTMEQAAVIPTVEEPTLTPEPELYAPAQVPSEESVYEEPQDRIESREAEEAILGDQLLRPAEGEVKEEVMPSPEVAADPFAAAPLVDNLPALVAVRDNNATPEQVQSLVDQGLVEQVDGQNIITEAGVAAMPEDQRPKLTPAERAAEVEGMAAPVFTRNEIIVSKPSVSRRSKPNGVDGESITEIKAPSKVSSPDNWNRLGDIEKLDATVEARLDFATGKVPKKADKSWTAFAGRKTKTGRSVLARNVTYNEAIEAAKDFVESANFQPQPTAAEKPTPDSVAVEPGATRGVQAEPVGGSIPMVGEVSPETEISSRENLGPKAAAAKKKQAAADEAAKKRQEKQDNATKSSLNSVVGPQKEDAIQGTVTKVDVETAREALTNSGEIPNAYLTNVYESLEAFLADKANARLFPSAYARLQTEKNIEGLYENGQTLIFAKQIQVSNLDRNLATMLGLTPEQAAARRVIAHENGHKAISLFTMAEKRELRGYLMRAYSDEQIAKLVETYDEYADWRTNLESRFEALEELLMRDFEKMEKIPTGGVWDNIVQFLKRVWRRLTGQNGEPTLKNLKDVARLMRNAMKRPAVPLGSFTLKDGGKVKLSAIAPIAGITPEMDAEYLAAVEAGDMEKAQRMVDEAAKKAGYILEKVFHGGASPLTDLSKGSSRGQAVAFFTRSKQDAWYYAFLGTPRKLAGTNLSGARRRQLSEKPQRNPSVTSVYIKGPIFDFSEGTTLTELQTWREILEIFGDKRIASEIRDWSPSIYEKFNDEQSLGETSAETFKEWINERWDDLLEEARDAGATEETLALSNTPVLLFLKSTQLLDEWAAAKNIEAVEYDDAETGAKTVTINNPNNAKSAAPITRDDAGNVIPPSQRFQPTSPDIRFSRPQFASDTDAATSAGNEAARSTIYSERDMDVREAIRRAYEAMPKDTSVAVPIGELFAKTEELMPGVTQDEFSNVLQDLFEDNGAVLQEGEQIIPEQEVEIQAFEKDNPFNELIRKSTEKSPSLGEINGVSKKFVQRVLRPASNFATNNGIRIDDNAPLQVRAMPDGSIIIGYSLSQERFDELQKMAPQAASQYTKDSVIEELIHLSDLIGLRNQWIKSGKKISFDQFVLGEQSNLAFSLIQKADSLNDLEAESLRRILASSLSLYNNNPEIANLSLNELLDLAAQYPYVLPELVRSLIQLKKTGQLTETAFRKIANVLREWQEIVLQWISDGYASAKEGVFGEMLSERIKNAENNLAQFSDTSEINVTTPEGRRAGFVVVMPRAAKASKIPIEDAEEASKSFKVDLAEAGKGRVDKTAKFKGKLLKDTEIPEHNVKSYVLYRDTAIKLIDDLMAKTNDILVVAEALQDPEFQIAVGLQVSKDVSSDMITIARSQIGIEIENRLANEIRKERNPRRKRELELAEKRGIIYYNAGTGAGQALQNRQESLTDPRYRGRNLFNQAKLQKEQKSKDKLDAITGGTEKITDIITKAEEKAAEETTQAEVEAQESAVEDDQDAIDLAAGEATLTEPEKSLYEEYKDILRRRGILDILDKRDASAAKASISSEERNALAKLTKAERDEMRKKDDKRRMEILAKLLGKEEDAKTPEQKKTRKKREKMVNTAKKRAEAGKSLETPQEGETESSEEQVSKAERTAQAILKDLSERYSDPLIIKEKKPNVDAMRELYKERVKQGVGPNQMTEKSFVNKAVELGADEKTAGILWKAAELEIDAREAMRQDKILQRKAVVGERADAQAHRIIFAKERLKRQSGFAGIDTNPNKDTIIQAFRDQVKSPVSLEDFVARLKSLNVSETVAKRLFTAAEREKIDLEAVKKFQAETRALEEIEIAENKASQIIYRFEEQYRQGFKNPPEGMTGKEQRDSIIRAFRDQVKNPTSFEVFAERLAKLKVGNEIAERVFLTASRERADLIRVKDLKIVNRKVEIASKQASRLIYNTEERLRQGSKDLEESKNGDSINKAFRDQISEPVSEKEFKQRLEKLNVPSDVAARLFKTATREKTDLEAMEAFKALEGPDALKRMLNEMNKARPADSVPLERAMPWRKILSSNPKDVAEYRQRIFEAISDLPSFQNLTDEQKERLADLYAEAWENRKQTILDRMLRDEIKKARDRDEISEDVEKKLQQSRNKILEIVNLGGFNNDDLIKVLGERYGISTSFTEEQKERIQKLADQLQDEDMNTAKRNKLAMEFAVELAGAMDVPVSEIISNWWTSSVLFGPQTIFSIGAAFLNGGYSIATIGTRKMLAKLVKGDIQGAIEESILMLKGFARYLGAFKQSGRRAWSYLWTGDVGLLGTGSTDILSEINNFDQLQRFQRHKLLAEKLAKDPRMVRRYVGVYLRFVSRLLTALDAFNVMVTKAGTASLALRMSGMSTDKIIEAEKMLNLKAYKDQVIRDYFDNKAPKTQAEKALVDSYAEAEMYRAINNLGGKMENADYLASESAMTMHPTGFGGVVYDAITGFFAQRQSNADEYLEKMKKDWISHKDLKAVTFLSLAYLRQFAAYNAAGLTGSKFVRYASNKFNQGLSFIPFAGLLRQIEAKDDRIKGKDAFRETIYRNQIVSFVMLMVGYSVIKAIQDEPDDEERGNFWNGGWANLTPDQKKQMLAKGQKEYTMGFKFNGRWYVFNYQNWPLNQILSAIGSMSDQVRFSPEKWDEKSALSKGVAGMVSGVKSTLEIPALSGLQDLVGNRLASKDPTERDLDRLSRVASGWVGGFVPRILKDIDFYTQPELRKYEGLWEKTASHIPIYRRYVGEEYYDILGQQIKRNVIPGSREFMMGPTEPEYKILGALNARNIFLTPANAEYRMVGKGRNRRRLTQEEADAYSLETGRGYRDMLLRYGQRALQMPTERARAFLQDKAEEVRDRALKRVYRR